jgi:chemotaxis protein MotB
LLKKYKNQLLLDITSEGLRIQIVDEQNRPMFALAKADLQPYTREILHVIGITLNEVPNRIGLSGHTDSTPYLSDVGYSNWELSSERANASRRELVKGGMAEGKILRVVGLASAANLDRKDPFNPINRRISIIVMNKKTEETVMRDNASVQAPVAAEEGAAAVTPATAVAAAIKAAPDAK